MYVMNVTDYDNKTDDYNDSLSKNNNCTINEKNMDIIIPALLFKIQCCPSFLCLISFIVYTLTKPLFNIKWIWRNICFQIFLDVVLYVVLLTWVKAFF